MVKICLVLMLVASGAWADWIEPVVSVQMGYRLTDTVDLESFRGFIVPFDYMPESTIDLDLVVGAELFEYLWIESEIITYMLFMDSNPVGGMFSPYQAEYGFRAGLQFGQVRLGYEHWCYHPVGVFGESSVRRYGGYDRVYLKYNLGRRYK